MTRGLTTNESYSSRRGVALSTGSPPLSGVSYHGVNLPLPPLLPSPEGRRECPFSPAFSARKEKEIDIERVRKRQRTRRQVFSARNSTKAKVLIPDDSLHLRSSNAALSSLFPPEPLFQEDRTTDGRADALRVGKRALDGWTDERTDGRNVTIVWPCSLPVGVGSSSSSSSSTSLSPRPWPLPSSPSSSSGKRRKRSLRKRRKRPRFFDDDDDGHCVATKTRTTS